MPDSIPERSYANPPKPLLVVGLVVVLAALGGLLAGAGLWLLADWVSQVGPSGSGWSLRGNGALFIPVAGLPALLAGGWTAIGLWASGDGRWAAGAAISALAALLLSLGAVFGPILWPGSPLFSLLLALAIAAGVGLAGLRGRLTRVTTVAAGLLALVALAGLALPGLQYLAVPLLTAPMVSGPAVAEGLVASGGRRSRGVGAGAGCLVLSLALAAGFILLPLVLGARSAAP